MISVYANPGLISYVEHMEISLVSVDSEDKVIDIAPW